MQLSDLAFRVKVRIQQKSVNSGLLTINQCANVHQRESKWRHG